MSRQTGLERHLTVKVDDLEAAMAFERSVYPHATPETLRLLVHARGAIRKFLDSDLGR